MSSSTRDADAKALRLFDVRTIERNIKKGMTTRKDYDKHVKALADLADKVAPPEEHPDEDTDDDDRSEASA
jgi:predicted kinase